MKFTKLTTVHNDSPIWINMDKIDAMTLVEEGDRLVTRLHYGEEYWQVLESVMTILGIIGEDK